MSHVTSSSGSGFNPTRPPADRIRFVSTYTGEHNLDTYLEHVERGGRSLSDLLSDLFNTSGDFNGDLFQFRQTSNEIQVRVGTYTSGQPEAGWSTLTPTLRASGSFVTQTVYNQLELVGVGSKLYIVNTDGQSYASQAAFEAASTTDLLFDAATFGDASEAIAIQKAAEASQSATDAATSLASVTTAVNAFETPTTGSLAVAQASATSATSTKPQIDTIYADIQTIQGNVNSNLLQSGTNLNSATALVQQATTDLTALTAIATQQTSDIAAVQAVANQNQTTLNSVTTQQATLTASATSISATQSQLTTDQAQVTTDAAAATAVLTDSGFIAVNTALSGSIATVSSNIAAINTLNTSFAGVVTGGTTISDFASAASTLQPRASDIQTVATNIDSVVAAAQVADIGAALEGALVIGPLILT